MDCRVDRHLWKTIELLTQHTQYLNRGFLGRIHRCQGEASSPPSRVTSAEGKAHTSHSQMERRPVPFIGACVYVVQGSRSFM